ncbi:MAG: hypothetical protein AAGA85_20750 [Bacteroidota bacterium]
MKGAIRGFTLSLAILLLGYSDLSGQSLSTALDWLGKNLDYQYYNADQRKWWVNRLDYNLQEAYIRIQNASADHPLNAASKQWIHRRVELHFLDPNSIAIDEIPSNRGRVVRGKVLVVKTVGNDRLIQKTIDGAEASSESFLQFSIPKSLLDEQPYFADSLKHYLSEAILSSARLTRPEGSEDDVAMVFDVFQGEFQCPGFVRRFSPIYPLTVEVEDTSGDHLLRKGFFGHERESEGFFTWMVSESASRSRQFDMAPGEEIVLKERDGGSAIRMSSLLFFTIVEDSTERECWRLSYD